MRRPISLYGLTFSLPLLVWQLLFFVFPLVFLVALSFWTVKNFTIRPDFNPVNWVTMFGKPVFWQACGRRLGAGLGGGLSLFLRDCLQTVR